MRILRLHLRHFRGFAELTLEPRGHVVVVGEPGAGRTDLAEALRRLLTPDSTRFPLSEPTDFYRGLLAERCEVEAVIGDLGPEFEQLFMDRLEVWDSVNRKLIPELDELDRLEDPAHEWVVRLCYRARWNADEKQAEHWVDYPRDSDPDNEVIVRVPRPVRDRIPFAFIQLASNSLDLGPRAPFRRIVEDTAGADFAGSLEAFHEGLRELSAKLASGQQVTEALNRVLDSVRLPMQLQSEDLDRVVQFQPEGGALGAIIRSLGAAVDLFDGAGRLPLNRHGSTIQTLLAVAEAAWASGPRSGIVVADDFGEGLDGPSTRHLAATLRRTAGQVWLTTRRASAAEAFGLEELIRLTKSGGSRQAHRGLVPQTKPERLAARHLHLQLLPAATSRCLVIVEGPHDQAALESLARRRFVEEGVPLPAADGITLVHCAAADQSGGSSALPRLAAAAVNLGFRTVGVIDGDTGAEAATVSADAEAACTALVRLPDGAAIERALVAGLPDDVLRAGVLDVAAAYAVPAPLKFGELSGDKLQAVAIDFLKSAGGLHAQFVDSLPEGVLPPLACRLLDTVVTVARVGLVGRLQL